jgi:glycerophosphoryl diester phosphodiesterase
VAHRGGCRTSDDCGASENSIEMLRMAERLGASRVEIDVQVTSDGIPIVYHDAEFGPLLTQGPYCRGPVSEFTWAHVTQLCALRYGESVPQLEEAIRVVADETDLGGVWLDVKTPAGLQAALPIVRRWGAALAERGRDLHLVLGLSTEELIAAWFELDDTSELDCLVELEVSDLRNTGCHVWAPRWTRGPMATTVAELQEEGYAVAFWTLDEQDFIDRFLEEAQPRALLTNRPGLAYHRAVMDAVAREEEGAQ